MTIAELTSTRHTRGPRMTQLAEGTPNVYTPPAAKSHSRRHCRCGACEACRENARWESIFQEKFADPNYYTGVPVRHSSPLRSF
jgi:hypothetical protein